MDKLILNLSIIELFVICVGLPFVQEVWVGEPYTYGSFGCKVMVPFHSVCDISEAFVLVTIAVFITEKLKGYDTHQTRVVMFVFIIYISAFTMNLPYFGVSKLQKMHQGGKYENYCMEDWNIDASNIFRVVRVIIQLFVPLIMFIIYHGKSWRIISEMHHSIGSKKSSVKYRSFSRVVSEGNDNTEAHYLQFTESEAMNLEMNHIYRRENSIASIQKDDEKAGVSVQIYTNEVTIDNITSQSPLWKGKKPASNVDELQKLVMSVKWFKYTKNLFKVSFGVSILYIISIFPSQIMMLYSLSNRRYTFGSTERLISQVTLCMRLLPGVINPWMFMFGVVKYRRSICKRSKCTRGCCCF